MTAVQEIYFLLSTGGQQCNAHQHSSSDVNPITPADLPLPIALGDSCPCCCVMLVGVDRRKIDLRYCFCLDLLHTADGR